jgi:hypothetical protein
MSQRTTGTGTGSVPAEQLLERSARGLPAPRSSC